MVSEREQSQPKKGQPAIRQFEGQAISLPLTSCFHVNKVLSPLLWPSLHPVDLRLRHLASQCFWELPCAIYRRLCHLSPWDLNPSQQKGRGAPVACPHCWVPRGFSHQLTPRMWLKFIIKIQSPQHEVYGFQCLLRIQSELTSSKAGIWMLLRKWVPIKPWVPIKWFSRSS